MKVCLYAGVLAVALLGLSVVRGQAPSSPAVIAGAPSNAAPIAQPSPVPAASNNHDGSPATAPPGPPPTGGANVAPEGLNDYLTYLRPTGCCGPLGRDGPINTEMFVRPGVSFPIGGSLLGQALKPGYMIQGGARALFFTPAQDLAWTVELGITTAWYDAGHDIPAPLRNVTRSVLQRGFTGTQAATDAAGNPIIETIPELPLTTSSVNETYVHLSAGHEVYLLGWADNSDPGCKLRVGYDFGGRWGSAKLVFKETLSNVPLNQDLTNRGFLPGPFPFKHRNDVVGGMFLALHSDVEVPYKCCILYAGVRTGFSYIFADLLQPQNNTDLMAINVLLNLGCRF